MEKKTLKRTQERKKKKRVKKKIQTTECIEEEQKHFNRENETKKCVIEFHGFRSTDRQSN